VEERLKKKFIQKEERDDANKPTFLDAIASLKPTPSLPPLTLTQQAYLLND